tara:strand:- start:8517 stop:10400 length:1884 start_codon:yes stop_codon:yes gene_type:complete
MRIDSPNVSNLTFQAGATVAESRLTGSFSGSFTGEGNFTGIQAEPSEGAFVDGDKTKLDAIEASATADQTDAEIRTAVEAASDSNVFTDADHSKLNAIEASADVTDTDNVTAAGALMDSEVTNLVDVKAFDTADYATAAQGSKADSAQQPPSEGAFANGDKTKLDAIEASADVTDTANVKTALNASLGGAASIGDSSDTITIPGNLTVTGTKTELQVATLNVEDLNITVASGSADSAAADGAGLTVAGAGATFTYSHSGTKWNLNKSLNVTGDITLSGTVDGIDIATDVAANTAKNTNVTTNLSITGTTGARTIASSDGTDAIIPIATTSVSGLLSPGLFDEIAANTAKNTNVSTNLSKTTAAAQITINSSDGDNVVIGEATGDIAGLMSTTHHNKLDGIEASATADQSAAEIRSLVGTGNSNFVPSIGTAGHFLKHDGTFGLPSYTTNTNTQLSNAQVRAAVEAATDSNVFTDADHTKLNGIEAGATADQTLADLNLDTSDDVRFDSFGVGTAASGTTGEIRATGDITAYYSSDERLKENFAPLEGALDKVNAMGGYEFDWKEGIEDVVSKTGHDIGVKAQEVQAQYPELVHERDNGYLAVDYIKLNAVLIQAVKELSAKVDELSK